MTQKNTPNINSQHIFFLGKDNTLPSEYIYDETYKNYKMKMKFQKDPKFSYFNAVMQMRKKLSNKEQVYKKVFQPKENEQEGEPELNQFKRTFFINNSFTDGNFSSNEIPQSQVVRVQKLRRNSYRIIRQQSFGNQFPHKNNQTMLSMNKTTAAIGFKNHHSNLSLYEKPSTQNSHISLQMISKQRNNKSHVQLQINSRLNSSAQRNSPQSFNPKPRLEQIMIEYRKVNQHSQRPKVKKSSLPKQLYQKLYMTNKLFYSTNSKRRN